MRWRLIFVVDFKHKIEPFKAIGASVSHKVARHERIVMRPRAQQVTRALALDTNDLLGNVHLETVSAAGLRR